MRIETAGDAEDMGMLKILRRVRVAETAMMMRRATRIQRILKIALTMVTAAVRSLPRVKAIKTTIKMTTGKVFSNRWRAEYLRSEFGSGN